MSTVSTVLHALGPDATGSGAIVENYVLLVDPGHCQIHKVKLFESVEESPQLDRAWQNVKMQNRQPSSLAVVILDHLG